jgi:hypothetical protein
LQYLRKVKQEGGDIVAARIRSMDRRDQAAQKEGDIAAARIRAMDRRDQEAQKEGYIAPARVRLFNPREELQGAMVRLALKDYVQEGLGRLSVNEPSEDDKEDAVASDDKQEIMVDSSEDNDKENTMAIDNKQENIVYFADMKIGTVPV